MQVIGYLATPTKAQWRLEPVRPEFVTKVTFKGGYAMVLSIVS
jgi:hypothetical protein